LINLSYIRHLEVLELAPKKYENAGLRVNPKAKVHAAASGKNMDSSLGGLEDDDAEAERSASIYSAKRPATSRPTFPDNLQRDKARKNEASIQGNSSHQMY
jgi:hypothetical protein